MALFSGFAPSVVEAGNAAHQIFITISRCADHASEIQGGILQRIVEPAILKVKVVTRVAQAHRTVVFIEDATNVLKDYKFIF